MTPAKFVNSLSIIQHRRIQINNQYVGLYCVISNILCSLLT
uniref:Uncharacterized protein n=1 Tax=Anguilla anguilla TaxID=7936 RepID=A0A0E9QDN3_ANGAN